MPFVFVYGTPDVLTDAFVEQYDLTRHIKDAVALAVSSDDERGAVTADWVEVVYVVTLVSSDTRSNLLVEVPARDLELRRADYPNRCELIREEMEKALPQSISVTCRLGLVTVAQIEGHGRL